MKEGVWKDESLHNWEVWKTIYRRTSFPDYGRTTTMEGSKHQNGENAVKLLWTDINNKGSDYSYKSVAQNGVKSLYV